MTAILFVAALTLTFSFLCSLFEAALYSITPSRLELLRASGVRGAARLARLREDVEEPIAAILTVNTVAHTVGSAWCGAMVGARFGGAAVGLFAAAYTVLVLVLTEIVPKSVGVRYASQIGPHIAWPLQLMIWAAWPVARPARWAMRRLTGGKGGEAPGKEELLVFSSLAARSGAVSRDEHRWIKNALRLDSLTAGDLRTPRTVVETLPAEMSVSEAVARPASWVHSRVPLTEGGDPDRLVGVALRREVFDAALAGEGQRTLRELGQPIVFVPETMRAHDLLERFVQERRHLFAVADEYGGFEGVVALEDVFERLLGVQIVDEHDEHADLQALARERPPRGAPPD